MKIHAWNQPVSRVSSVPSRSTESLPPPSTAVSEARPSHVAVSQPGQLISKLMQLKQEDPDKFKEVVSGLAASLRDTAGALDGRAAKRLDHLATKLDDIANGGDIGQLGRHEHVSHGHHGHHGHHGVGGMDGDDNGLFDKDGDSVPPPSAAALSDAAAPATPTTEAAPAATETDTAASTASASETSDAPDIHQIPTLVPPSGPMAPPSADEASPTRPWNAPPALLAFSRFGGHHEDDADREAIKSAFANLLEQLDTALAG
jgi:hypothetical protein